MKRMNECFIGFLLLASSRRLDFRAVNTLIHLFSSTETIFRLDKRQIIETYSMINGILRALNMAAFGSTGSLKIILILMENITFIDSVWTAFQNHYR